MGRRGPILVCLALALAAVALAAPSAHAVATKAIWGPLTLPAPAGGGSAFNTYAELGVDVFQIQLSWRDAAPGDTRPAGDLKNVATYTWPSGGQGDIDDAIAAAQSKGMQVAILVKGTPRWARAGDDAVNRVPDDVADFANFLTAASTRYPYVNRWMIWGETNRNAVWSSGPAAYSNLLDAAYAAIKAEGAGDVVTGGMTFTFGDSYTPKTWIDGMKCGGTGVKLTCPSGTRPSLDEYGHNAFARRCPDLANGPNHIRSGSRDISDVDTLKSEVTAAFASVLEFDDKLWISEYSVSSDRANRAFSFFVSRATQADWLTRAYKIADSATYVSGIGWFNLHDESTGVANGLTGGLMEFGGAHKPAFNAYKSAPSTPSGACPKPASKPEPAPDKTNPVVKLTIKKTVKLKTLLKKGLRFKVRCSEPCSIKAKLLADKRLAKRTGLKRKARKPVRIGKGSKSLSKPGTAKLKVKLTRKAKRKLKRARRGTLILELVVEDDAGNETKVKKKLKLRR